MGGKQPGFYFYAGDWLKDPALRRCSKAAKGCWIDMLAILSECPVRGVFETLDGIPWSDQEVAAAIGGDIAEDLRCVDELLRLGVASRLRSGAIFCRRMVRDQEVREQAAKRKRKQRKVDRKKNSHADVTHDVTHVSEEEIEREIEKEKEKKEKIRRSANTENFMQRLRSIGFRDSDAIAAEHEFSQVLDSGADMDAVLKACCRVYVWTGNGRYAPRLADVIRRWKEPQHLWKREDKSSGREIKSLIRKADVYDDGELADRTGESTDSD